MFVIFVFFLSCLCAGRRGVFFFQAEDGIRDADVTGVQTCALPIWRRHVSVEVPGLPRRITVTAGGQHEIPLPSYAGSGNTWSATAVSGEDVATVTVQTGPPLPPPPCRAEAPPSHGSPPNGPSFRACGLAALNGVWSWRGPSAAPASGRRRHRHRHRQRHRCDSRLTAQKAVADGCHERPGEDRPRPAWVDAVAVVCEVREDRQGVVARLRVRQGPPRRGTRCSGCLPTT